MITISDKHLYLKKILSLSYYGFTSMILFNMKNNVTLTVGHLVNYTYDTKNVLED